MGETDMRMASVQARLIREVIDHLHAYERTCAPFGVALQSLVKAQEALSKLMLLHIKWAIYPHLRLSDDDEQSTVDAYYSK